MKFKNFYKALIGAICILTITVFAAGCGCSNGTQYRHEQATEPETTVEQTQPTESSNVSSEAEVNYFDLE